MPPKSVKGILNNIFDDLESNQFKKFKKFLSYREEGPRIPASVIEKADQLDMVDVLVRTYTEKNAISVAIEVLKDIDCHDLAEKLENYMNEQQRPQVGEPTTGGETTGTSQDRHFVDIHRAALIQRVNSVAPISDDLLGDGVLNSETYNDVNAQGLTNQARMRRLYDVISASGREGKDLFYESLQKHEKFLVKDLRG